MEHHRRNKSSYDVDLKYLVLEQPITFGECITKIFVVRTLGPEFIESISKYPLNAEVFVK